MYTGKKCNDGNGTTGLTTRVASFGVSEFAPKAEGTFLWGSGTSCFLILLTLSNCQVKTLLTKIKYFLTFIIYFKILNLIF